MSIPVPLQLASLRYNLGVAGEVSVVDLMTAEPSTLMGVLRSMRGRMDPAVLFSTLAGGLSVLQFADLWVGREDLYGAMVRVNPFLDRLDSLKDSELVAFATSFPEVFVRLVEDDASDDVMTAAVATSDPERLYGFLLEMGSGVDVAALVKEELTPDLHPILVGGLLWDLESVDSRMIAVTTLAFFHPVWRQVLVRAASASRKTGDLVAALDVVEAVVALDEVTFSPDGSAFSAN